MRLRELMERLMWRKTLAIVLFLIQLFVLLVSMDMTARNVMAGELKAGQVAPQFERGLRSLREALIPQRLGLLVCATGLFVLVLVGKPPPRGGNAT